MTDFSLIKFPLHIEDNGYLSVFEVGKQVPFQIQRVFTVTAPESDIRGEHAHKKCSQLLVCVSGKIKVSYDNGKEKGIVLLEKMSEGILIPPGTWAIQEYMDRNSVLMVLCDRVYEEDDYLRDYQEFLNWRENNK
jgi:dTDP-4-dehydrorhamnose 3,5-epimerase-like enzyme